MYKIAEYHFFDGSVFVVARKDFRSYKKLVSDANDPTNKSPAYRAIKEGKLSHVTLVKEEPNKETAYVYANIIVDYLRSKGRTVLNVRPHRI
jgi:hypothetical protein